MDELEAATIADTEKPEPSTPLDKLVAEPVVSLKALQELSDTAAEIPTLEHVVEPETKEIATETPEQKAARDDKGRFTKTAEKTAEDDDDTPPTSVSQFQKRLDKERWKRGELERQAKADRERLEREIAALRQPKASEPAAPVVAKPAAKFPSFEDYATTNPEASYEDYLDARTEAKIKAELTADRQRLEAESRDRALAGALHHIYSTLGPQRHADFEAVTTTAYDQGVRWAPHITEFVLHHTASAEEAADLTYALLKDPALVDRLNRLPQGRAWFEIGKLTVVPPSAAATSGAAVAPPVTRAPAPITPVGTSAAASPLTPESLVKGSAVNLKKLAVAVGGR